MELVLRTMYAVPAAERSMPTGKRSKKPSSASFASLAATRFVEDPMSVKQPLSIDA